MAGHLNVEGSYADAASLRTAEGLGVPWLFIDPGHREKEWSEHCNNLHARWMLHNHGIPLHGPPARELVDDVPAQTMRDAARAALPGTLAEIREWAPMDHAWTQRYIVQTYSRVLYTALTGKVASKPAARSGRKGTWIDGGSHFWRRLWRIARLHGSR